MNTKYLEENGVDVEESLELLGDLETYHSIMEDFLSSCNARRERMKNYKEHNDLNNYAIEVHSLKSDSKYLGFTRLAELSLKEEEASKENNYEKVEKDYDELLKEFARIEKIITGYLKKGKVDNIKKVEEMMNNPSDKKIILIADDSDIIREFVIEIFNEHYQVVGASTGREVAELITANPLKIATLLLDLNMPDIDGFGVLEWFKHNNLFEKIPVSIITGANDKESISRAFNYPIVSMLNKPFEKKDVKETVEKTIHYKEIMKV